MVPLSVVSADRDGGAHVDHGHVHAIAIDLIHGGQAAILAQSGHDGVDIIVDAVAVQRHESAQVAPAVVLGIPILVIE